MRFTTAEVATATGGVATGDAAVDGVTIDSRTGAAGRLFVAVVADRDGHDFVPAAAAAGATAVLVDRSGPWPDVVAVQVGDTAAGLTALGREARRRLAVPVIAVTGSVGKTTVKDLCAAALSSSRRTAASERSFNNELGVPLTLVNAADDTEAVVLEMGARGPGHIADLCAVSAPTIGLVTVVAAVHTETFGDIDGVARAKGELVAALPSSGAAVLNADDARVAAMASATSAAVIRYGTFPGVDVTATEVVLDGELRAAFRFHSPWGEARVRLAVRGRHQVGNALGAATAALVAGAPLDGVVAGLASPPASPWRMAIGRAPSGLVVLDDSYNANPTSMAAALAALAALPARRRFAYLGTMAELGPDAATAHAGVAALAGDLGITVVPVGEPRYAADGVADVGAAAQHAVDLGLGDGDAVLVKASRVARLERLAARLTAGPDRGQAGGRSS